MIRFALLLAIAFTLTAQTFDLGADRSDIYLGETLQLRATLRNVDGSQWNLPLTYSSDNPAIAEVSTDGQVQSRKLGSVRLRVSTPHLGGLFGSFTLRVIPYLVKLSPERAQIEVGQNYQLEATAYNVFEQPIPEVQFNYELYNALIQAYPLATVDAKGKLNGLATGPLYVRASLIYDGLSSRPGTFDTWSAIDVVPKNSYTPALVYKEENSFAQGPATLRPAPGFFTSNGTGTMVFSGSLNSYAGAVFSYTRGVLTPLASAGVPAPFPGGVVSGFQGAALNRTGQTAIAVNASEGRNDGGILMCTQNSCEYIVLDGYASTGEFSALGFARITSESLNASGTLAFLALFRGPDGVMRDGLFQYKAGRITLLWDTLKPLPGQGAGRSQFVLDSIERSNWSHLTGLSINDLDNIIFIGQRENIPSGRCLYRLPQNAPERIETIYCTGMSITGLGAIKAFGNVQSRPDGTIAMRLDIGSTSHLAVLKAGKLTTLPLLANANSRLFAIEGNEVLFYGKAKNAANQDVEGLIRWTWNAATRTVVRVSTILPDHGMINEAGATTIIQAPFIVTQILANGAPSELLRWGLLAGNVQALHLRGMLRTDSPIDRTRLLVGDPLALVEVAGNTARPLLLLGDTIPGTTTVFLGAESILEDSTGTITITNNDEIFRSEGAGWRKLVALDQAIGSVRIIRAKALATNKAGVLIFECLTTANDRRLMRLNGTVFTEFLRQGTNSALWGGSLLNWTQATLDESGRLMLRLDVPGGRSGYYFHNGSSWASSIIELLGVADNQRVVEVQNLRAVGNRFYTRVVLTAPFLNAAILESDDGIQWRIRAKTGDPLPVGPKLAFIHDFDANASGDLLLRGTVEFSGIPILLLNRGRALDYVHMLSRPVVDNEYLVRYDSIDLRDDGSVVFSAYDASDRPIIYRLRRN